jgi:hypothetical protein
MRLGISKTEAWNSAAGEAAWLTAAACEAAGSPIEILSPQDRLDFAEILSRSDPSSRFRNPRSAIRNLTDMPDVVLTTGTDNSGVKAGFAELRNQSQK